MSSPRENADVVYLSVDDVLFVYATAVGCSMIGARDRLSDSEKLESALYRPRMHAYYDPELDLADQAALLADAIVQAHAFSDGNKRTAALAVATFLRANGYELATGGEEGEEALAAWLIGLAVRGAPESPAADGDEPPEPATVEEFAAWLRAHVVSVAET